MIIIQQALNLGGYPVRIKMREAPNYARKMQFTKKGYTVIMNQDAWDIDFDDSVYKSSPFIAKGDFVKGIYVTDKNRDKFRIRSVEDLRQLCSVSNPTWTVDRKTLEKLV